MNQTLSSLHGNHVFSLDFMFEKYLFFCFEQKFILRSVYSNNKTVCFQFLSTSMDRTGSWILELRTQPSSLRVQPRAQDWEERRTVPRTNLQLCRIPGDNLYQCLESEPVLRRTSLSNIPCPNHQLVLSSRQFRTWCKLLRTGVLGRSDELVSARI